MRAEENRCPLQRAVFAEVTGTSLPQPVFSPGLLLLHSVVSLPLFCAGQVFTVIATAATLPGCERDREGKAVL